MKYFNKDEAMDKNDLDFSVRGMSKLRVYSPDKIHGLLLYKTHRVRSAIYKAIADNPSDANLLLRHFLIMVRNLDPVDKIQFRTSWKMSNYTRLKYLIFKTVDERWMNLLDNMIDELTEHDITEIELNKYIPPFEMNKNNHTNHNFSHYLISDDPELLAEKLKSHFAGMKGKNIAIMILALEKLNWIAFTSLSALHLAIKNDFGNIGSYQSVNDYYSPYKAGIPKQEKRMLTDDDIKPFISKIEGL